MVHGNRTFLDFDVTDLLGSAELRHFQEETGLRKSPVTLVLPGQYPGTVSESLAQNRVVVAFLHGLGGCRKSWGTGDAPREPRQSFVLEVLRSIENLAP